MGKGRRALGRLNNECVMERNMVVVLTHPFGFFWFFFFFLAHHLFCFVLYCRLARVGCVRCLCPTLRDLEQQGRRRAYVDVTKSNKVTHPPRKMREPGPPPPRPGFHPPGQEPGQWATERMPMIWNTMGYHTSTLGDDVMFEHQGPQWIPAPPVTPPAVWKAQRDNAPLPILCALSRPSLLYSFPRPPPTPFSHFSHLHPPLLPRFGAGYFIEGMHI